MAEIILYTTTVCPYCVRAKMLLNKKGVSFTEINVAHAPERRKEMLAKSGGQRHHRRFAQAVDRRVGHLGKVLPEEMVQAAILVGQHSNRRIVAH